jgi:hypothetical protein
MSGALTVGLFLLCIILFLELLAPEKLTEGFEGLIPVLSNSSYFSKFIPKRGDVGPLKEQPGFIMDGRYFHDYTDVQRLGVNQDYCRMVVPTGNINGAGTFFACALGGTTDIVSSTEFKTNSVDKGFLVSRDDYMNDIVKDGRYAYCRILKGQDGTYQPLCRKALDTSFSMRDEADPNPPATVATLLTFYDGCVLWLRLYDDMLDYTNTVQVYKNGNIEIDERPRPLTTRGLNFDGVSQFLRIGDDPDLSLGNSIKLRTVRAFSLWVYVDEFTNNAHFFDFGDGGGNNNVFLGILGKGDQGLMDAAELRPLICGAETTVPSTPSGAQAVVEMTAQKLMKTTAANVDDYVNIDQEVRARILPPSSLRPMKVSGNKKFATLHYEVWDQRQRKMSIKINSIVPLRRWTHIVVTAMNMDATRPDIGVFVNGEQVYVHPSGFLPQSTTTTNNYLGKSNWTDAGSTYELRDELFSGSLFDFRMYTTPMSESKIKDTMAWGKSLLSL